MLGGWWAKHRLLRDFMLIFVCVSVLVGFLVVVGLVAAQAVQIGIEMFVSDQP